MKIGAGEPSHFTRLPADKQSRAELRCTVLEMNHSGGGGEQPLETSETANPKGIAPLEREFLRRPGVCPGACRSETDSAVQTPGQQHLEGTV